MMGLGQAASCRAFIHWSDFGIGGRGQLQGVLSKLHAFKVKYVGAYSSRPLGTSWIGIFFMKKK